jgi:hypothetical protein
LLVFGVVGVVGAQAADAAPADGKQRLIEQKMRLVESLVQSPAAKKAAAESGGLVSEGEQLLNDARQALAAGDLDTAAKSLDAALKATSKASARHAQGSAFSESAQRASLADLQEQVKTYRASIVDLGRDSSKAAEAKSLLTQVDFLAAEGDKLAQGQRLAEANKKFADAYKLAVEGLSRLRSGQTVTMSLKFDTPADEYAYEQKRYGSNEILVDMMQADGKAQGSTAAMVTQFVGEARRLKAQAAQEASSGQHGVAVKTMEQAVQQLTRALQVMGVPVF